VGTVVKNTRIQGTTKVQGKVKVNKGQQGNQRSNEYSHCVCVCKFLRPKCVEPLKGPRSNKYKAINTTRQSGPRSQGCGSVRTYVQLEPCSQGCRCGASAVRRVCGLMKPPRHRHVVCRRRYAGVRTALAYRLPGGGIGANAVRVRNQQKMAVHKMSGPPTVCPQQWAANGRQRSASAARCVGHLEWYSGRQSNARVNKRRQPKQQ